MERTLAIIKPDACKKHVIGKILARIEAEGFSIVAMKKICLSKYQAEGFYFVHSDKSFFSSLTDFMSSGPAVVIVLEGENMIARWRECMGPTNPANAPQGTLRQLFGSDIQNNAVHGSDSPENARIEINYFFPGIELF
jgi:nucleoside-diphosphate kinase